MTRGQMKTLIRKQLRDTDEVDFDDTEIEEILNIAYGLIQKEIVKVSPEFHIAWDTIPTEIGVNWYPLPPTFGLKRVAIKSSSSDTGWTSLKKSTFDDIENSSGEARYCVEGQWIGIFPAPTAVVSDGIRIAHTPLLALADDDESPKIKTPLHLTIVLWAKVLLLGETEENTQEARSRIAEVINDLDRWYQVTNDANGKLRPDL